MDIYHRDHWIIDVHMATWKDLTKWNKENTIMDWINHMGMIVKRVFPVPSRLQREGHTYYLALCTISYLSISSLKLQVPGCARLCMAVLGCTWLY